MNKINSFIKRDYMEWKHNEDPLTRNDKHGAHDNNYLTEIDREYFNIIEAEDGLSHFFQTKRHPPFILQI